jgi:hypothetical protein
MKVLSQEAATALGYKSITIEMHPRKDKEIIHSMEETLRSCDAVWMRDERTGCVQAARKKNQLAATE